MNCRTFGKPDQAIVGADKDLGLISQFLKEGESNDTRMARIVVQRNPGNSTGCVEDVCKAEDP